MLISALGDIQSYKSKKGDKDQESIQSSNTPDPGPRINGHVEPESDIGSISDPCGVCECIAMQCSVRFVISCFKVTAKT